MLKSALTDALSGTPASQQQQRPAGGSSASSIHLDPHVFPCLYCDLPETAGPGDASEYGPDDKQEGTTRAGTVPHSSSLADGTPAADYDLNPFRRRGGKESVPGSLAEPHGLTASLPSGGLSSNFLSQQVIGSLPKGMSVEERASVARLAPLSPTLAVLKEMGGSRVGDRNVEAKQLRRHVLRGTVIVFIAAGYSGKRFVFERAKELGVRSVIVDGPDSWSQALVAQGLAEKFVPLDFSDADGVFERCLSSIKKVRSALGGLDGIVTFCEMAVPLVSRLAEALNLPGNSPEAVDNARDKHAARSVLQKAGLPSPKHFLITQPEHLSQAADHVGFPAVIKPIHGAASIGVVRVDDMTSLQLEYAKVIQQLKRAVIIAGALQEGGDDDPEEGNAGSWICLDIMMEEYLDGPEVDCDLVFSGGRVVYGCITDNWPTFEPYFLETGSNCPSTLPRQQQAELLQLSVDSCKALGMSWGVFHVEGKYTSRGPRLIEVNCRMGGGPVRATNLLVWGVDLVEEALLAGAGIPSQPPTSREPLKCLAEYSINAPSTGILRSLEPIERFQQEQDVHYVNALCEPGSKVVSATDGLPTWIVELMVFKPNVQEAIDYIKTLVAACEAEIAIDPQ